MSYDFYSDQNVSISVHKISKKFALYSSPMSRLKSALSNKKK